MHVHTYTYEIVRFWHHLSFSCVSGCTYVYACMCRPEIDVQLLPQSFPSSLIEAVTHWTWKSPIQLDWQTNKAHNPSIPDAQCWGYSCMFESLVSPWALDIPAQVPLLKQQASSQLNHPSSLAPSCLDQFSLTLWTFQIFLKSFIELPHHCLYSLCHAEPLVLKGWDLYHLPFFGFSFCFAFCFVLLCFQGTSSTWLMDAWVLNFHLLNFYHVFK